MIRPGTTVSDRLDRFGEAYFNAEMDLRIAKSLDETECGDTFRGKLHHLRSARKYALKFIQDTSLPPHYAPFKDLLREISLESGRIQRETYQNINKISSFIEGAPVA